MAWEFWVSSWSGVNVIVVQGGERSVEEGSLEKDGRTDP